MKPVRMPEDTYGLAIKSLIVVCTDAVVVNRARRTIYLATRATEPMAGLWWIGGRSFAGEKPGDSISRCFHRETGLNITPKRFQYVMMLRYMWATRAQMPQDAGSDNLAYTYAIELNEEELAKASTNLDQVEYQLGGLKEFSRDQLVAAKVHQAILDFYDELFPV